MKCRLSIGGTHTSWRCGEGKGGEKGICGPAKFAERARSPSPLPRRRCQT